MAWPSGTKASTTNVDAGSDKPRLARPDIKQNIDNVKFLGNSLLMETQKLYPIRYASIRSGLKPYLIRTWETR